MTSEPSLDADVIVVGAGNAALCAALAAREQGADVLVLEKAPEHLRGGNTYFTGGGFRFPYRGMDDIRALIPDLSDDEAAGIDVGAYPQPQFYDDLMRVTESLADPDLAQTLVSKAYPTVLWMRDQGLRWVLLYGRQAYRVGDKLRFWGGLIAEAIGGGAGLSDGLFEMAHRTGVRVQYDAKAVALHLDDCGRVTGLTARMGEGSGVSGAQPPSGGGRSTARVEPAPGYRGEAPSGGGWGTARVEHAPGSRGEAPSGGGWGTARVPQFQRITTRSVVLASGGFEANPEMRTRYLGQGWELARVRGTRYNTGDGIRMALDAGAQPYGH